MERSHVVREALRWIVARRQEEPHRPLLDLVSEAGRRFNLSPRQEEEVLALLQSGEQPRQE